MSATPRELGELVQEVHVPAREARCAELTAGQVLQVVDLQGRQVGDMVAYLRETPAEYLSPAHTCSCLTKLVPEVGDEISSNHRTPLFRILADDVGTHDLVVPCCDPERYANDYGQPDHGSCLASLERALAEHGSDWKVHGEWAWNVFMNNRLEDGRIVTHAPEHGPGAAIDMLALEDLVVCLSACPQDLSPCNDFDPTDMALRVWQPES